VGDRGGVDILYVRPCGPQYARIERASLPRSTQNAPTLARSQSKVSLALLPGGQGFSVRVCPLSDPEIGGLQILTK
jgi:hypothetical protein